MREVQLPADEPRGPLGAAGRVHDAFPGLGELDPEVVDHLGPELLGLLDRDLVQIAVARDAEPAHQPGHVRLLEELLGRRPDEPAHGRKAI